MDDRNLDLDALAALDVQQVSVVDVQGQDVLVDGLDHHQVVLAVDVQLEHGVNTLVTDQCVQVQGVDVDVNRVQLVAVDNQWDPAVATQATGCALTELGAQNAFDTSQFSHECSLES